MLEFCWHLHHKVLLEPLTGSLEERIAYIQKWKPLEEIETRLRLLRPVQGKLPTVLVKAGQTYKEAWQTRQACGEAWQTYEEARQTCKSDIETLHAIECPGCPWNGKTIFPKMDEDI